MLPIYDLCGLQFDLIGFRSEKFYTNLGSEAGNKNIASTIIEYHIPREETLTVFVGFRLEADKKFKTRTDKRS